jgi:hypothetical protein
MERTIHKQEALLREALVALELIEVAVNKIKQGTNVEMWKAELKKHEDSYAKAISGLTAPEFEKML